MTPEQKAQLEIGAKALFAANWLCHDAQDADKGNITYRGITVERSLAPMLAYADAEQYWQQNTHVSPKQDWMGQLQKTATGLLKGLANEIVAGSGPKASRGEEGAYAVGVFWEPLALMQRPYLLGHWLRLLGLVMAWPVKPTGKWMLESL